MSTLFLIVYFTTWTLLDLPFFILGAVFGIGPDRAFYWQFHR